MESNSRAPALEVIRVTNSQGYRLESEIYSQGDNIFQITSYIIFVHGGFFQLLSLPNFTHWSVRLM